MSNLRIYGGNLQMGSASMPDYNGENIAATRGVMVVSTNYRTNGNAFPLLTIGEQNN
jgi:carboxylesterase type B